MTKKREVCGAYPGAVPWTTHSDEPPAQLAAELARSAGCAYYTVDGVTYGPFDESAEEEAGALPAPCLNSRAGRQLKATRSLPVMWAPILATLGCASPQPPPAQAAPDLRVRELETQLEVERGQCGAAVYDLQRQIAEANASLVSMSHSMLDKAEAVVLLKLQAIAFQRQVAELAGDGPDEELAAARHDLKAQLAEIDGLRRSLPVRPPKDFDLEQERLRLQARDRVLAE